jgi:alginate O-acetyltransferase complex protein AlgI
MLFSSPEFLFGFLPAVIFATILASRIAGKAAAIAVLVLGSLFFYGWWNPWFLLLICGSVVINYLIGRRLVKCPARALLCLGIVLNLGVLCYFKYAGFLLDIFDALTGAAFSPGAIVLPLAISFFTFQQIAFLVDAHRGEVASVDFLHYGVFVVFFPQLIAGPIVHHGEIIAQFRDAKTITVRLPDLTVGLTFFAIGLYKKIVIADTLGGYANPIFAAVNGTPSAVEAWGAVLCFTFQIYFDFSGYSDMAIGLARIFGIKLPVNFHSPYKATSIIEFWRRWHITLSRFLRDYLYYPLGGNRKGQTRRYVNLLITMLLGGLWHGAGWTFVFWGILHGVYLIINHAWHALLRLCGRDPLQTTLVGRAAGRVLTFFAVAVGWVFFRSADWATATNFLDAMMGINGLAPAAATPFSDPVLFVWLGVLLAVVWCAPNTHQCLASLKPVLPSSLNEAGLSEQPSPRGPGSLGASVARLIPEDMRLVGFMSFAALVGLIAVIVMITRTAQSPFIYFVF